MFAMVTGAEDLATGQRTAVLLTVTPTDRWLDDHQQWRSAGALDIGDHVQSVDQPLTKVMPTVGEVRRGRMPHQVAQIHEVFLIAGALLEFGALPFVNKLLGRQIGHS